MNLDRPLPPLPQEETVTSSQASDIAPFDIDRRHGLYEPRDTPFPDPASDTDFEEDEDLLSCYSQDSAPPQGSFGHSLPVPDEESGEGGTGISENDEETTILCFMQGRNRYARVVPVNKGTEETHQRMAGVEGNGETFVEVITDRLIVPQ